MAYPSSAIIFVFKEENTLVYFLFLYSIYSMEETVKMWI